MQKYLLKNIFLLLVLNLLVKPFYILGIDAEVQQQVGEAAYGKYFALLNLSYLLSMVLDLGTANYLTRRLAAHPLRTASRQVASDVFVLRWILIIPYVLVSGGIYILLGYELQGDIPVIMGLLIVNQILIAIIQYSRAVLGGMHRFAADRFLSVSDRIILIAFIIPLLWGSMEWYSISIMDFVQLHTLSYSITACIALVISGFPKFQMQLNRLKPALWGSLSFALLALMMMLYTRVDAIMIERIAEPGALQAGYYAQGFRLLDALSTMMMLITVVLLPVMSRLIASRASVEYVTGLAARLLIPFTLAVALFCSARPADVLALRYSQVSAEASTSLVFLMFSLLGMSVTYVYGTLLTAAGDLRFLNMVAIAGLVVNIALNALLIPFYGAQGAALATLFTQCGIAVFHLFRSIKLCRFKFQIRFTGSLVIYTLLLLGYVLLPFHMEIPIWQDAIAFFLLAAILWFVLKLSPSNSNEIKQLIAHQTNDGNELYK